MGWRYTPDMLTIELVERLRTLTAAYGRVRKVEVSPIVDVSMDDQVAM